MEDTPFKSDKLEDAVALGSIIGRLGSLRADLKVIVGDCCAYCHRTDNEDLDEELKAALKAIDEASRFIGFKLSTELLTYDE